VKDPKIAEKLIPKNHGFGTRRLPLETNYFEVYNQSNVTLVDIDETPIERITEKGVKTSDCEHEFDVLIYSTGFDGVTGPYDHIDIRGSGGRCLKDEWQSHPRTYLGIQAEGYPNMLMILGPHTARGNIPRNIEQIVEWVTGLVKHIRDNGITRIEPRPQSCDDWEKHVRAAAAPLLSSKVASWQTGVNRNVEGRQVLRVLSYAGSAVKYQKTIDQVAAGGYREFLMRRAREDA
jgi:cation diffusion facilitator CzcD-associated flavoprotein CzcO